MSTGPTASPGSGSARDDDVELFVIVREGERYFDLVIDGVDDEGRGRAVIDGWDFAVRGAFPGDVVTAVVERTWPQRQLAQLCVLEVTTESALVGASDCPYDGPCAGCPLDGVDEGFAHAWKRARVVQALVDVGLAEVARDVDDVVPSRAPRQKVKLTAAYDDDGALTLGLYAPHSHDLEDATQCPHHHPAINRALAKLATALAQGHVEARIKAVIARAFIEGVGVVVVTSAAIEGESWRALSALIDTGPIADPIASLAVRVDDATGSVNSLVGGAVARSAGPQALTPLEGGPPASVDAFCQTDSELATWMYARVAAFLVDPSEGASGARDAVYLDAYAGAGGFARALVARGASHVVAVERAPDGARALRSLAVASGSGSVEVMERAVEDALPALAHRSFAGVVVDPPKAGLREAAAAVAALGAPRVALVACDPDAGARDVKAFVDAGYRVDNVLPVDLFPATVEIETLYLLSR